MYLISDPVEAKYIDYYNVDINGAVQRSDPELSGDGTQKRLHHPVGVLSPGTYTASVQPVNEWAEGEWSPPLSFESLGAPPPVTGLALSKE